MSEIKSKAIFVIKHTNFLKKLIYIISNQFCLKGKISVFAVLIAFVANSQTSDVIKDTIANDSVASELSLFIEQMANEGLLKSEADFIANKQIHQQHIIFDEINMAVQKANTTLKGGFDYSQYSKELNSVIELKDAATKGILIDGDTKYLSIRNLTTTNILLNEILNRTNNHLKTIDKYDASLSELQFNIDSLNAEKIIYMVPADSAAEAIYFQKFLSLSNNVSSIKSRLENALDSVQNLQILSNIFKNRIETDLAEINRLRQIKKNEILSGKEDTFSAASPNKHSFAENLSGSFAKGLLLLVFYFINHYIVLLLMLIFLFAFYIYLKILKKKFVKKGIYKKIEFPVEIFRHPLASSIIVVLTLFQFLLPVPPFLLLGLLWFFSGFALVIINHSSAPKFNFYSVLVFFVLNILAIFDNLILGHSVTETWFILGLAGFAMSLGLFTLYHHKKFPFRPRIWLVLIMVILEFFSIVLILTGNYNAAKVLMVQGIFTVLIGYLLMSTFLLLRNIIGFSNFLKESDEEKNHETLNIQPQKITLFNTVLFIIGWFVLVSRNMYFFQEMAEPFGKFLKQPREIGQLVFTYEGILLFLGILVLSAFISRVITFLATQSGAEQTTGKSGGVGSWLLLIKIGIITAGIVIAFISVGIKMDKIAIIISALGVGIGFGLQTLINNLVSGLIIAFEKPINLDDIVEINGQIGKMKSIGIRASVVTTWDGADVIIPNGDLLSQHLVNWTMGSTRRRYELQVGVAYGSDLNRVKSLFKEVLDENRMVLKNPQPMIWITTFNESSIDFSIKYWVGHFIYGNDVKSDLMIAIDQIFKENNIVIPFPQRDLHIRPEIQTPKAEEKPE